MAGSRHVWGERNSRTECIYCGVTPTPYNRDEICLVLQEETMPEEKNSASGISNLPYRVRVDGSTIAAFGNYDAAAAHAKRELQALMGEGTYVSGKVFSVEIQFSLDLI